MEMLDTPVAFIIFNRPETTQRVFAEIRKVRPRRLLVIGDGPRPGHPGESEACAECRRIVGEVDWPCQVEANFAERNLGCKNRVSSGLDWVFDTVEEAIILEDDCVPHPDFFELCVELLARYRDDERVMHIGGANLVPGPWVPREGYHFSRYLHVWGWASWRRAWRNYDVRMKLWPEAREKVLAQFEHPSERRFWRTTLERVYQGEIDTWDFQWAFASWLRGGLGIVPAVNLVTNIGFGAGATHTTCATAVGSNMTAHAMVRPLAHPSAVFRDGVADQLVGKAYFRSSGKIHQVLRLAWRIGRRFRK